MASGTFNTTSYDGKYLVFTWSTASVDVGNNRTLINYSVTGAGNTQWHMSGPFQVAIDGEIVYNSSTRIKLLPGTVVCSGQKYITHNGDGTRQFYAQVDAAVYSTAYNVLGGQTFTLDTIGRTSIPTLSASSVYTGNSVTINTNRASTSFTHTLTYAYNGSTGTIATGVGASYSWTVPHSILNATPNTSGAATCIITCSTYNGSTFIGSKVCYLDILPSSSVVPTVNSGSVSDGDSLVKSQNWGLYLDSRSYLVLNFSGSGSNGSTITYYRCKINNIEYSASSVSGLNSLIKNISLPVGTLTIQYWVVDSRGRASSIRSMSVTVVSYTNPSITTCTAVRCNSSGTETDDGSYLKVALAASVSPCNNKNSMFVRVGYKLKSASTYTYTTLLAKTTSTTSVNYTGSSSKLINANFNSGTSYDVIVEVTDSLTTNSREKEISTGFDLIHFHKSGRSIAFGKKSEARDDETKMEIGMDLVINGKNLLDVFYPVGAIYTSMDSTSPESLFGGKWTQITNRFLYCTTSSKGTGGNTVTGSTTLTENEIPKHYHDVKWTDPNGGSPVSISNSGSGSTVLNVTYFDWAKNTTNPYTGHGGNVVTGPVGGDGGHTHAQNLPPYMTCYAWYRTA